MKLLIAGGTAAGCGNGSFSPARAIQRAHALTTGQEALLVNIHDFADDREKKSLEEYRDDVRYRPHEMASVEKHFLFPWSSQAVNIKSATAAGFTEALHACQPDVIVSTHFEAAMIVSKLRESGELKVPHAIALPDFDLFGPYLQKFCDHYFVALQETMRQLCAVGVDPSRITVSGIPVSPEFAKRKDKQEMRAKYGLSQDRPVVLLSGGGDGLGEMLTAFMELTRLPNCQLIVVCGRNEQLLAQVRSMSQLLLKANELCVEPLIIGWTDCMDELMRASDLLVGKTGGSMSAEALAAGLPVAVVHPIPGLETRNAAHLVEQGAAIYCNNTRVMASKIQDLLDKPARLAKMRRNARRLGRPRAAFDIAQRLQSLDLLPPTKEGLFSRFYSRECAATADSPKAVIVNWDDWAELSEDSLDIRVSTAEPRDPIWDISPLETLLEGHINDAQAELELARLEESETDSEP